MPCHRRRLGGAARVRAHQYLTWEQSSHFLPPKNREGNLCRTKLILLVITLFLSQSIKKTLFEGLKSGDDVISTKGIQNDIVISLRELEFHVGLQYKKNGYKESFFL